MPQARGQSDPTTPRRDLRTLLRRADRPILMAVAGDSGSGKTTYTHGIRRLLGADMVSYISLDGYHKEDRATRRKTGRLPLDPRANDLKLFKTHLQALRAGAAVEVPIYNHATGCFDEPRIIEPRPVIIIEGLHALYPNFLPYYDFTAKYAPGGSRHELPAKISPDVYQNIRRLTLLAHRALGCRGVSRADFRLDDTPGGTGELVCLEVNTQPGMTATSLVPELAGHAGWSFGELVRWMVEDASCNR